MAFERIDAADLASITLARDEVHTALVNRMPTRDPAPITQPGTRPPEGASVVLRRLIRLSAPWT